MSYLVLARKWRPRTFDQLVGQEHVRRALTNALDSGRIHHAFLFTGTRGVGKTTIARIFAKSLNCETGISSKPCGVCPDLRRHRWRPLRRPARSRRGIADQGRRYARAARQRAVLAGARSLQGLPDRRSAHAVDAFVQRAAEDARRAAAARQVPARDHRSAETAGHRAVALPAVPFAAPAAAADLRPARADLRGRERRVRTGGVARHRAGSRRQHARCAVAARPGAGLRWRARARDGGAHAARHARPQARAVDLERAGHQGRRRADAECRASR